MNDHQDKITQSDFSISLQSQAGTLTDKQMKMLQPILDELKALREESNVNLNITIVIQEDEHNIERIRQAFNEFADLMSR